jgi:hypothetical protein
MNPEEEQTLNQGHKEQKISHKGTKKLRNRKLHRKVAKAAKE